MIKQFDLKKHYVAFLDILGFTELVKNSNSEEENVKILSILYNIQQNEKALNRNVIEFYKGLKVIAISDSIIITMPYADGNEVIRFVKAICNIAYGLLVEENLLLRGGVALGECYHEGNIIFGKAYLEAVELEKNAKMPNIIVSSDVFDNFIFQAEKIEKTNNLYLHKLINPSERYIDYLSAELTSFNRQSYHLEHLKKIDNFICAAKKKFFKNENVLSKYIWFEKYFLNVSKKYSLGYREE